ncbi:MAG: PAS domain-containing protein [Parvibaculum sp.]|uniref:PAS domain-containing protein n=1 Tax=Parvibaculum sp. TaxID=2024848 RepID=UPI003C7729FE
MLKRLDLKLTPEEVDYEVIEAGSPIHPKNRILLDYWLGKMGPDGVVQRSAINPLDFRKILGGVFLVEPVDDGQDLVYRLVGSENEHRFSKTYTGRRFTECYGKAMADDQIAFHHRVFAAGKPAFLRGRMKGTDVDHAQFEASYLPLRTDSGGYQMLGGMFDMAEPE